jgi:Zn ribbon nucleic-acid-binding protein
MQNPLAEVRFEQTSGVVCENCNYHAFSEAYLLRKVSKFLVAANSNKDQIIPVPVFHCVKCGHVNKEFLPEGFVSQNTDEDDSTGN